MAALAGRARLPGSRTSFCALTWHRPGGVQITGTPVTRSRTGIICTIKTPGRCRGTQVTLCKWNMTSDTNSHVAAITGYRPRDPAKMLLQSMARWDTLYQGVRVWSQMLLDHMECHKIIGREKYYERLSFIDAIWKVGHVIIYFPKLKGGHKTNLPFKYDWTSIFKVFDFWNHPFLSEILLSCMHATSSLTSIKHHIETIFTHLSSRAH